MQKLSFLSSLIILLAITSAWQFPKQQSTVSNFFDQDTLSIECPDNINVILEHSCYDCHSNKAGNPMSKGKLNFSNWEEYTAAKKISKLEKICKEISDGKMPKKKYLKKHPEAKLSKEDISAICEWTQTETNKIIGE